MGFLMISWCISGLLYNYLGSTDCIPDWNRAPFPRLSAPICHLQDRRYIRPWKFAREQSTGQSLCSQMSKVKTPQLCFLPGLSSNWAIEFTCLPIVFLSMSPSSRVSLCVCPMAKCQDLMKHIFRYRSEGDPFPLPVPFPILDQGGFFAFALLARKN